MQRLLVATAIVFSLHGVHAATASPPLRLPPRDECTSFPAFNAFRSELVSAVHRRDVSALKKLSALDIMYTSDGEKGWRSFVENWGLERTTKSDLWRQLATVLELGCARDGDNMTMPYYFARLPEGKDEGVIYIPVRNKVPILFRPDKGSRVVTMTHWDVLYARQYVDEGIDWIKVTTGEGKHGFVQARDVRADVDYRAAFRLRHGRWEMSHFLAGD